MQRVDKAAAVTEIVDSDGGLTEPEPISLERTWNSSVSSLLEFRGVPSTVERRVDLGQDDVVAGRTGATGSLFPTSGEAPMLPMQQRDAVNAPADSPRAVLRVRRPV